MRPLARVLAWACKRRSAWQVPTPPLGRLPATQRDEVETNHASGICQGHPQCSKLHKEKHTYRTSHTTASACRRGREGYFRSNRSWQNYQGFCCEGMIINNSEQNLQELLRCRSRSCPAICGLGSLARRSSAKRKLFQTGVFVAADTKQGC